MTKNIKWRLSNLPSTEELRELVQDGLLSKDEARGILFTTTDEEEKKTESQETEIKFLKELVLQLTEKLGNTTISYPINPIVIKQYERYMPYYGTWCSTGAITPGNNIMSVNTASLSGYLNEGSTGTPL